MTPPTPDPILTALLNRDVDRQYRPIIRDAAVHAGIGAPGRKGDPDRLYIAELMAYYLGKGAVPIPPRTLSTVDLERWAKRRAWTELERHAARLPALVLEREPIDTVDELERRRRRAAVELEERILGSPRPPAPLPPAA